MAYFQRIRKICDETGILLMCDEVQVGMGRSGKFWGYENLGIEPDVFTSAKGLAAASQLGLLCANHSVMYSSREIMPARLAAIPLLCSGTVCVKLERENLLQNVEQG